MDIKRGGEECMKKKLKEKGKVMAEDLLDEKMRG